jgi:ATP-dependent exoDNAse (exonuclease V) alpha subunit
MAFDVVGMPVRIQTNQCIAKGVANGATGQVFHIDWSSGTQFEHKDDGVWVASPIPTNLFVDMHDHHSRRRFPSIPDAWPTSVMPLVQTRATFLHAKDTISIKGFPVVPAFGTTVHGVQGDTRDKIVITDLRPPHFHRIDRHTLYVAL